MMDLMHSGFTAVHSTLPACAMIPNQHNFTRHDERFNFSGPVHTNPFSNEKGAVLLRFQKDLRTHLSFSYRFHPSTLQRRIRFENAFISSVCMLK